MLVLGIADHNGPEAYALVKGGDILYAGQDGLIEKLRDEGITSGDIDCFCYFEKPLLRLEREIESHLAHAPRSFAGFCKTMPHKISRSLFAKRRILDLLAPIDPSATKDRILFSDHILSLCAEAFYPSFHEQAMILCLDHGGEWSGTAIARGDGHHIIVEREIPYPHSLGLFLEAFASYLNVPRTRLGELARQGQATYSRVVSRNLIDLKPDGSFRLNQSCFDYAAGGEWTSREMHDIFGQGPRNLDEPLGQKHYNIAASVMAVVAQAAALMVHMIAREFRGVHALCVTGTLAGEEIVRERILRDSLFDHVDIRPDAGNRTLAIGAALAAVYAHHETPRDVMFLRDLPTRIAK